MASIQQTPQGPVLVLKESALQQKGRDAQANNIMAAKLVADLVRTSLGPRGMDKMLVDSLGDVTITNDGATILKEIDVQHPAAKMMVEVAKSVDNEVGPPWRWTGSRRPLRAIPPDEDHVVREQLEDPTGLVARGADLNA